MIEKKEPFELDISKPSQLFKSHLELEDNFRIIFSGPFGSGKTYFLKKYFENSQSVIHLFPVNYSVSSNEDIFELLKYDLLFQLLRKNLFLEKVKFSKLDTLSSFLNNKVQEFLSLIINNFTLFGNNFATIKEQVLKLNNDFLEYHRNQQIDEQKQIIHYLKTLTNKTGHLYGYFIKRAEIIGRRL